MATTRLAVLNIIDIFLQKEPAAPAAPAPTYTQPQAPLSNRDVMSALNNAPAVPTEALPQPAQRERREDPPVADLISF